MSVNHDPVKVDASAPYVGAGQRRGASLQFDIGDGGAPWATSVAGQMRSRLLAWARDPELYALIVYASADTTFGPTGACGAVPNALSAIAWELDCFSKPLVSLLPAF